MRQKLRIISKCEEDPSPDIHYALFWPKMLAEIQTGFAIRGSTGSFPCEQPTNGDNVKRDARNLIFQRKIIRTE